jgi:O6-methylguanine-DNA--protein-cysteine methyltransferase
MNPSTINPDEMLKSMAAQAVKQHEQIRTTIRDITLKALQMRDLSLEQINGVVRNVTAGVNIGVGENKTDTKQTLSDALAGMDDALLKVVEANKVALQKLTDGGASFEESSVKKGLKELEAFEEKFLDGVKNAIQSSSDPIKQQWTSILDKIPRGGTETGAQVMETLNERAREAQAAVRSSREAGLKAMHTITQNYATLVSGVLIGLSEAFEQTKTGTKR